MKEKQVEERRGKQAKAWRKGKNHLEKQLVEFLFSIFAPPDSPSRNGKKGREKGGSEKKKSENAVLRQNRSSVPIHGLFLNL